MHDFSPDRRRLLRSLVGIPTVASALGTAGCSDEGGRGVAAPSNDTALTVALARLPEGEHVRLVMGERPVDVVRTGARITARSLWCTHMGCEVAWRPADRLYHCPCHAAVFDADGNPIAGPTERPLRRLATRVEADRVVIEPPRTPS